MTTLVIKNLPDDLHARLRQRAQRNHRSLTREAVSLIEGGLDSAAVFSAPDEIPPRSRSSAEDGRAALRAALVEQPDGSYVNVLAIEDDSFFAALDRIRADTAWPDPSDLFEHGR